MPNLASDVSGGTDKGIAPLVRGRLPRGPVSQRCGALGKGSYPIFPIFATLWEPLGPLVSQFSRSFSQFQQNSDKKIASKLLIIQNYTFSADFP